MLCFEALGDHMQRRLGLSAETIMRLRTMLPHTDRLLAGVQQLHLLIFFFTGVFYHLSMRMTKIGHVDGRSRLMIEHAGACQRSAAFTAAQLSSPWLPLTDSVRVEV